LRDEMDINTIKNVVCSVFCVCSKLRN